MSGSNPFSTRFWRAGVLPFIWPADEVKQRCHQRLADEKLLQVVGPHGTGKSTLILGLAETIEAFHGSQQIVRLSSGMARRERAELIAKARAKSSFLILDGAEQLTWLEFQRVRRQFKPFGLLITTHRSLGLPTLLQTDCDFTTFERLVDDLLASVEDKERESRITTLLPEVFQRHSPNLREMLFELYDCWEK